MTCLSHLSVDELADGICLRSGRIAAAEAELIAWIGEFDARGGWAGVGMTSCAAWLSWRTGLSPGTARERVRVAKALRELPVIAEAFSAGLMSWSQVRAITRVAHADDRIDWVDLARSTSGAQIEKVVRGLARAQAPERAMQDCELAAWQVRTRKRYDSDGNLVITITARPEAAPVIEAAIDLKRAELERQQAAAAEAEAEAAAAAEAAHVPAGTQQPLPEAGDPGGDVPAGTPGGRCGYHAARPLAGPGACAYDDVPAGTPVAARVSDGDALLAIAQDALDAAEPTGEAARRTRFRLTANVDPLSGWARLRNGELLPPTSLKTVLRSLPGRDGTLTLRPVTPADLRRFDLGRTQRQASTSLRELIGTLDGERCRFPGCTRYTRLHAHHVVFWSNGGPTDLDNLVKPEYAPSRSLNP